MVVTTCKRVQCGKVSAAAQTSNSIGHSRLGRKVLRSERLDRRLRSGHLRQGSTGIVLVSAKQEEDEELQTPEKQTEKFGLEVGLFKTLTDKTKPEGVRKTDAKGLLTKYGSAYLLTSISFALVSFLLCYFLVGAGVDVAALLGKLGLNVSSTSERVGKFALAYAAHKAASPIRFPPTVALTPVVAKLIGSKGQKNEEEGNEESSD